MVSSIPDRKRETAGLAVSLACSWAACLAACGPARQHRIRAPLLVLVLALAWATQATAQLIPIAAAPARYTDLPVMLAIEKGYFRDGGLDVRVTVMETIAAEIGAVAAGEAAFANVPRHAAIAAMALDETGFQTVINLADAPGNDGCWARQGIARAADLRGRKVAAADSSAIVLGGLLRMAELTTADVTIVDLPVDELSPALRRGDIDAACAAQPLLTGLKSAAPDGRMLGTDLDTPAYKKFATSAAPDILIVSRSFAEARPDAARGVIAALLRASGEAAADPEGTAAAIAHWFKKPPEEVLAAIKGVRYHGAAGWPDHAKLHSAQMQSLAQQLYDDRKVSALPDTSKWENTGLLPKP